MVKVRVKDDSGIPKLVTPYGIITKEWKEVPDGVYIFNELEVYQEAKAEPEAKPVEEPKVEEAIEEPKVTVIEEDVKIVEEPEPEPEVKVKKKGKRKR